jgi:UDP-perosamine 4-acetyltransferase
MDVVIIGAGGHGRVVLDILRAAGRVRVVGFLDADPGRAGTRVDDVPVLGAVNMLPKLSQQKVRGAIVAIGDARARKAYLTEIQQAGLEPINAIHPSAIVSPSTQIGVNVVIAAGAVVSTDVTIGDGAILNTGSIVDHECIIGPAAHICPGAMLAGRVTVGEEAFIGLGAKVIQCRTVGDRAIIGAGAVIIRDVPSGTKVVGVPGRVI